MKTRFGQRRAAAFGRAWHLLALVVLMATTIFGLPQVAYAATFTVTKTADTNDGACNADCSLREAIVAANNAAGADTITVPAGTYLITRTPGPDENAADTGDFDLLTDITITGAGAGSTIIDAQSADRVFDINPFGGCTCTINLNNLTVQNGKAFTDNFNVGGGIFIGPNTTINISNSTISGSQSASSTGGGIENRGALTLNNVTVQNNTAFGLGGGINSIGSLTVNDSTFSGNKAESGGAIYINTDPGKTASVSNSVFTSNQAVTTAGGVEDSGGAIAINTDNDVTLTGNSFSGNSAAANGGAIYFADSATLPAVATLTMSYNRITGNTATTAGNGLYRVSGTAAAQKNWWGCNGGPSAGPCNVVAGTVNYTPWVRLNMSYSPPSLNVGQSATLDADFLSNSDSSSNSAGNLGKIIGTPITFGGAVLGTLSNVQSTIQSNGHATATYTANGAGAGSATATVDNQTLTANFTNIRASTTVSSITRNGTSPTNAASVSWTVTFAASVTGLTASNFALAVSGLSGPTISGVSGSGATWTVTATTSSGSGTLGLNLANDTGVDKSISNAPYTGQVYSVDRVAPDTTITGNPSNPSNSASATFVFTGTDTGTGVASFQCRLDVGTFTACASPQTYTGLIDLIHIFSVRAVDAVGNVDPSPASFIWVVDTTAPDTSITSNPSNPSNSSSASFGFSGDDSGGSGVASFECKLDSGSFAACSSPQTFTGLSDGSHTFQVRAIDAVGNVDPTPASFTWVVDTTPPDTSITSNPSNPSNSASAAFSFTGTDGGSGVASFECKLDSGSFAACSSPQNYTGLGDGSHTFQVRAVDAAGNVDPTPAAFTWVIDTSAPDTTITGNPSNPSASSSATFTFTSSKPNSTFECMLDSGGFAACSNPKSLSGLSDGSHTFQVRAIDALSNVDPSPASFIWVVDTTPPDTTISSNPSNPSNSASATFVFTGTDSGSGVASFQCQMDGGGFSTCTSPQSYSSLSDGSHTFQVRAIDGAGNIDPSPASFTWTIDTVAPSVTIDQASSQADPTSNSPIHFTVVFNEPVTGFTDADVTLGGTAGATTAVVTETAPNNGTTYDVAVSGMITDGTVIASIAANKATDLAGNGNAASTSTDNTVTYHVNRAPVADAGAPQTVTVGSLVTLTGVASSDPESQALTFGWSQVSGTPVSLNNASAVSPTFSAPNTAGTLVFQLFVTDTFGAPSAPALVTVTVMNSAPTANAGAPQTVTVNASVMLNGSASSDPEHQPLTFGWSQVSGAPVTLSDASAASPTFTAPAITGTLVFQLVVTDSLGAPSAPAVVTITVTPAPVTDIPPGEVTITLTTGSARLQPSSDFTATIVTGTEPITFVWDFGDGSPLFYGQVASHVYAPGHYTATLTATNSAGTVTSTIRVFVPWRLLLSIIARDAIMPRALPPR